uniref:Uncharacterized protein n=1 Tax=Tetranychus urticae TaxID=32264 RepID=T1KQD3_TETUR
MLLVNLWLTCDAFVWPFYAFISCVLLICIEFRSTIINLFSGQHFPFHWIFINLPFVIFCVSLDLTNLFDLFNPVVKVRFNGL